MTENNREADARNYLEAVVSERAHHSTAEEVRTTCSFARAERLLGREYHGRFLIELLQNAADAWRGDPRACAERSRVAIVIGAGPALMVANQGTSMTADVVIDSLGHIGASTKPEGEAIGHKGIGFKSVLEVTHAPEIYSGLRGDELGLAVSFNPVVARNQIVATSQSWQDFLSNVDGLDPDDDLAAIPILRFPHWMDTVPHDVTKLAKRGFDTVVRLPFTPGLTFQSAQSATHWLQTVRQAIADLSDQILVLLGCFSEVTVEDHLASTNVTIRPVWAAPNNPASRNSHHHHGTLEEVRVLRNYTTSSHWRIVRRTLPAEADLAGEVAVGLRVIPGDDQATSTTATRTLNVVSAVPGVPSAPFHLFFPTRIASGLPLLLHGYFEVDAARTGFYRGSSDRNKSILAEMTTTAVDLVCEAANDSDIDLATLVNLIANCNEPEDELAQEFRAKVLRQLDGKEWIPVKIGGGKVAQARPEHVLVAPTDHLARRLAMVFPPQYVSDKVSMWLPDDALTDRALRLIRTRPQIHQSKNEFWDTLGILLRPAERNIWTTEQADPGFLALLDLIDALRGEDARATETLISELQGDLASRLLPAIGPASGRQLLPIPNPAKGVAGQRSALVMARIETSDGATSVPPKELDLAFLPEGLLPSEAAVARATELGVRPFTVDTVLDRLNGIQNSTADPRGVVEFLWQLLVRARVSAWGTKRSAEIAAVFDANHWFWCRPDRARDDTGRVRQQRERYLSEVLLPARDGQWRPAGSLAFGSDWAAWLETNGPRTARAIASRNRADAYRALEAISPGSASLIAAPADVLPLLDDASFQKLSTIETSADTEDEPDDSMRDFERHAFLLRLGVWEVPPIEAWSNSDRVDRLTFPWTGPSAKRQELAVDANRGWTFGLDGWGGKQHHNVYLTEDFRFAWPLDAAAKRDARALTVGLRAGLTLYAQRLGARVFCPGCHDSGALHRARRESNAAWEFPSCLALELRHEPWLECVLDGEIVEPLAAPAAAWWREQVPSGAGLRQSPWRMLPMCSPATGVTDELRRLIGVNTLKDADLTVLTPLLRTLRNNYEAGSLAVDPAGSGGARQAFVGLHRLAYERLAELADHDAVGVSAAVADIGVLCEFGDRLEYATPAVARHDDGRYSTYVRHFAAHIPFVVLPRPQTATAKSLCVSSFEVHLSRAGADDGLEVTDDLHDILGDRIPELLAIVVHHSPGGQQTLELDSEAFATRSRRLQSLTVRQVRDLVIHAEVADTDLHMWLGKGSYQDIYLENPSSTKPVLFLDLNGDGWQDRLRRKIAPHLAAVLENGAYADIFALFLLSETDGEREEFLLERGITGDDVDVVAARIGVVGKEEHDRNMRWYRAVLTVFRAQAGHTPLEFTLEFSLDEPEQLEALLEAVLPASVANRRDVARAIVAAGGGEAARRETAVDSPLHMLWRMGVDLTSLDHELRRLGDAGLSVSVTQQRFARWIGDHGRRVVSVLATQQRAEAAKSAVSELRPPEELALSLDPSLAELLEPVAALLCAWSLQISAAELATDPATELARLGRFASTSELDAAVLLIYNEEEQRRVLQARAAQWRREIRLIAVLSQMGQTETRASIRKLDERAAHALPSQVSQPSELIGAVQTLFADRSELRRWLIERLDDSIKGEAPDRTTLLEGIAQFEVDVTRISKLIIALDAPRRHRARAIKARSDTLMKANVAPRPPKGLAGKPPPKPRDRKLLTVAAIKVDPRSDRRKRELGDEGEQWALAAMIGDLLRLSVDAREQAIDEVVALLRRFEGSPVEAALSHAVSARSRELDEEELIDELTGLLHVSLLSDAFGFDLVGWVTTDPNSPPQAVCLEVKSSSSASFRLSSSEWATAEKLHTDGVGDQYAVLVVRRSRQGKTPSSMDLLDDPVSLLKSGRIRFDVDGWTATYS